MDAVVHVGGGGGVCPVTKATLVVVNHRSRGRRYKRANYPVQRLGKDEDEEEKDMSSFSSLSFDSANTARGTEVKTATDVAEMVDDEG